MTGEHWGPALLSVQSAVELPLGSTKAGACPDQIKPLLWSPLRWRCLLFSHLICLMFTIIECVILSGRFCTADVSGTVELLDTHIRGCISISRRTAPLPHNVDQMQTFIIKHICSSLKKHEVACFSHCTGATKTSEHQHGYRIGARKTCQITFCFYKLFQGILHGSRRSLPCLYIFFVRGNKLELDSLIIKWCCW